MIERINIGIFGKINAGKSTLMNIITMQNTSLVDEKKGTTADVNMSIMEIHEMGPVKLFDTPGLDEEELLGEKKKEKALLALKEIDLALIVIDPSTHNNLEPEKAIIELATSRQKKWLIIYNLFANNLSFGFLPSESAKVFEEFDFFFSKKIAKGSIFEKKRDQNCKKIADSEWIKPKTEVNKQKTNLDLCNTLLGNSQNYLACDLTKKEARLKILNFINNNFSLVTKEIDLFSFLQKDETVFLNIPMDEETPEKRLLRPQAFIQENLLRRYVSTFCYRMDLVKARSQDELIKLSEKERFLKILRSLKKDSNLQLLITDSQAIDIIHNWTLNENIAITTFSIVMAHVMSSGRLRLFEKGIQAFKNLKKGDSILIAEACNHNRMAEDIGTVQIPKKIEALFGKGSIQIDHAFGREFSQKDLKKYKLIIHCGGCMIDKQKMNARIEDLIESEIPLTNYGMILSYLHSADSLMRVLGPFL